MTKERDELPTGFFRALVDHLSDLVIVIDARGGIRFASDAGITGAPRGTLAASDPADQAASFFDLIHPDDRRHRRCHHHRRSDEQLLRLRHDRGGLEY